MLAEFGSHDTYLCTNPYMCMQCSQNNELRINITICFMKTKDFLNYSPNHLIFDIRPRSHK